MKSTARSARVPGSSSRKGGGRLGKSGEPPTSRMRVLAFACHADDAQHIVKYGDRVEIAYLPSYDMEEIRGEIERFNPNLVLCSAGAFLDTYPAQPSGHPSLDRQEGNRIDGEAIALPISRREMRVLAMLARGQTNAEIANDLRVSSRTVKRILSSLYERLHVTNRTELTGRVAELSLLKEVN